MTKYERRLPYIIDVSRRQRISDGSGSNVAEVNALLEQFRQMQKMMKKFSAKGGMAKMMRGMGGMLPGGGMPKM